MTVEGRIGTPVPLERTGGGVPFITAETASGAIVNLAIDTGHPDALLIDVDAIPELAPDATTPIDLEMFGVTFHDVPATALNLFVDHEAVGIAGIIGYEVFAEYNLTLDHLNGWAAISRPFSPAAWPAEVSVGPTARAPFTLEGVNSSRPVLSARIEGVEMPVFIDTGAFAPVVYPALRDVLEAGPERPRIGGLQAMSSAGVIEGYITRLGTFELPTPFGTAAELDNLVVVVFPEREPPDDIARLGIGLSIASTVLDKFVAEVDYSANELRLSPHSDTSSWLENPYIGPGFTFGLYTSGWRVNGFYEGTEAEESGIEYGDYFLGVGDVDITTLGFADMRELRRAFIPGEVVTFHFERDDEPFSVDLTIVDLLPLIAGQAEATADEGEGEGEGESPLP